MSVMWFVLMAAWFRYLRWLQTSGHVDLTYAIRVVRVCGLWQMRRSFLHWTVSAAKVCIMRLFSIQYCSHCLQSEMTGRLVNAPPRCHYHEDARLMCVDCDDQDREHWDFMWQEYYSGLGV